MEAVKNIVECIKQKITTQKSPFHYAALLTVSPIHTDFVKNIHSGVHTDLYTDYISTETEPLL